MRRVAVELTGKTSRGIENARLICIVMMSYVHLHFAEPPDTAMFSVLRAIVVVVLGRSSVPLLSVISGILMTRFFARQTWLNGVRHRFRALILPMIAWNVVAVLLFWPPGTPLVNSVFALTAPPQLEYSAFLRDLFVLSCLTPALLWAVRTAPWITAVAFFAFYVANVETVVVLRPQIAGFFGLGVFIGVWGGLSLRTVPILLALVCVSATEVYFAPQSELYDLLVRRPVTAAAFWVLANHISVLPHPGRAAFVYFLAHGILFHMVGALYARAGILDAYILLWLATPPLLFALVAVFMTWWTRWRTALPAPVRSGLDVLL